MRPRRRRPAAAPACLTHEPRRPPGRHRSRRRGRRRGRGGGGGDGSADGRHRSRERAAGAPAFLRAPPSGQLPTIHVPSWHPYLRLVCPQILQANRARGLRHDCSHSMGAVDSASFRAGPGFRYVTTKWPKSWLVCSSRRPRNWQLALPAALTVTLAFVAGGFFPGTIGLAAGLLCLLLARSADARRAPLRGLEHSARRHHRRAGPFRRMDPSVIRMVGCARPRADGVRPRAALPPGAGVPGPPRARSRTSVGAAALGRIGDRGHVRGRARHSAVPDDLPDQARASTSGGSRSRSPTGTRWACSAASGRSCSRT